MASYLVRGVNEITGEPDEVRVHAASVDEALVLAKQRGVVRAKAEPVPDPPPPHARALTVEEELVRRIAQSPLVARPVSTIAFGIVLGWFYIAVISLVVAGLARFLGLWK